MQLAANEHICGLCTFLINIEVSIEGKKLLIGISIIESNPTVVFVVFLTELAVPKIHVS